MKSPNDDSMMTIPFYWKAIFIIFIQITFYGEFKKFTIFVIKTMIFPKTEKLWQDENILKTKNAMLPIY